MRRTAAQVAAALALVLTAGCAAEPAAAPSPTPTPRPARPVTLTLGVTGPAELVASYRTLATEYTAVAPNVTVQVKAWPDEAGLLAALRSGTHLDVALTPRSAVTGLAADHDIVPVDDPLEDRDVDLADSYSREAIEDFSVDHHLQCMPYSVDPTVMYVNTRLVDFKAMKSAGLSVPGTASDGSPEPWSLKQFATAMTYATQHHRGVGGAYVDTSVRGLAPWLAGAGSSLFDDPLVPMRTSLSKPVSPAEDLAQALTGPGVRVRDLGGRTALDAFAAGRLAAYAGTRADVPQLRRAKGLDWEVLAMPGGNGTAGDYSGLCVGARSVDRESAADLLAYLITKRSVEELVRTGRFVPVNSAVGYSTVFTQPYAEPDNGRVFTDSVRDMQVLPGDERVDALQQAIGVPLQQLVDTADPDRVDALAARVDELSARVFPQPSPSASP